jgi:hypothetical protein
MSELKPCPFCGGRVSLALGGENGMKWWVITRATNKNGVDACKCRAFMESESFVSHSDGAREKKKALIAAWNRRTQPANEPLTIEQLKQMDGEPVWCADGEGHSCYCLVNAESEDCIDSECGAWCFEFYGMTGDGENGLHNMGWLAYAHKPGGEQE